MATIKRTEKDPNAIKPYGVVWCSRSGLNSGAAADTGFLQGATISASNWIVPSGLTQVSANTSAITIDGITYGANTVATIWLSGGTAGEDYQITNRITTSDGRTDDRSLIIQVKEQ